MRNNYKLDELGHQPHRQNIVKLVVNVLKYYKLYGVQSIITKKLCLLCQISLIVNYS